MKNVPAASCTTSPTGQTLIAACIRAVSSEFVVFGLSVAQTVEGAGMPPAAIIPGFQTVARSAGRKPLGDVGSLPATATREAMQSAAHAMAVATEKRTNDGRGVAVAFMG